MNISGISGNITSSLLYSTSGSTGGAGLKDQLQTLQDAIDSGDLDAVQEAFDSISQNKSGYGDDPVGQFLSSVEDALSSGDLGALGDASAKFSSIKPPGKGQGAAPPPPSPPPMAEEAADTLSSLIEALDSSDEEAARSAYDALIESLSANDSSDDGDNPLKTGLAKVGEALSSGDLTSAREYLNEMLSGLPNGSIVNAAI